MHINNEHITTTDRFELSRIAIAIWRRGEFERRTPSQKGGKVLFSEWLFGEVEAAKNRLRLALLDAGISGVEVTADWMLGDDPSGVITDNVLVGIPADEDTLTVVARAQVVPAPIQAKAWVKPRLRRGYWVEADPVTPSPIVVAEATTIITVPDALRRKWDGYAAVPCDICGDTFTQNIAGIGPRLRVEDTLRSQPRIPAESGYICWRCEGCGW